MESRESDILNILLLSRVCMQWILYSLLADSSVNDVYLIFNMSKPLSITQLGFITSSLSGLYSRLLIVIGGTAWKFVEPSMEKSELSFKGTLVPLIRAFHLMLEGGSLEASQVRVSSSDDVSLLMVLNKQIEAERDRKINI